MKLNIGKILATVGGAAINMVIPGAGSVVVGLINGFLPDDKKLPENATGAQAQTAIDGLPAKQRNELMLKECDVEIAEIEGWSNVISSLAQADTAGASTRPGIAKMMAWNITVVINLMVAGIVYAIVKDQVLMVEQLKGAWPLALAILGTPTALLRAYFGLRSKDKKVRAQAATGGLPVGGLISQVAGMFKK